MDWHLFDRGFFFFGCGRVDYGTPYEAYDRHCEIKILGRRRFLGEFRFGVLGLDDEYVRFNSYFLSFILSSPFQLPVSVHVECSRSQSKFPILKAFFFFKTVRSFPSTAYLVREIQLSIDEVTIKAILHLYG